MDLDMHIHACIVTCTYILREEEIARLERRVRGSTPRRVVKEGIHQRALVLMPLIERKRRLSADCNPEDFLAGTV